MSARKPYVSEKVIATYEIIWERDKPSLFRYGTPGTLILTDHRLVLIKDLRGLTIRRDKDYSVAIGRGLRIPGSFAISLDQLIETKAHQHIGTDYLQVKYRGIARDEICFVRPSSERGTLDEIAQKLNEVRQPKQAALRSLEKVEEGVLGDAGRVTDADFVETAKKYGGVLTLSTAVLELKISLNQAKLILDRFCRYGEAREIRTGQSTIYEFPNVRSYLGELSNRIITVLIGNPQGITRPLLVNSLRVPIKILDEALTDLEKVGIVVRKLSDDSYALKVIQQAV